MNAGSGYAYDLKGALEYDPSPTDPDRTMLGYNAWDLMDEVVRNDNGSPAPRTDMVWDADEQRLRVRNVPTEATWSFVYDTAAGIPAVLVQRKADMDNETLGVTFHVREPGGELLASFESGGAARYYHFDALGSAVMLSDGSGNPAGANAYGAWGDVLASPASWQPYQYVGQLGYYTHTTAQGTQLADWLQLGVRFYQPGLGRFERRDPIRRADWASYTYGLCRPSRFTDPTGHIVLQVPWAVIRPLVPEQCKGINCTKSIQFIENRCGQCAWALADSLLGKVALGTALGAVRGGIASNVLSQGFVRCMDVARETCVAEKSGALAVRAYVDCIAGRFKIDAKTLEDILKNLLKEKLKRM